jgi:hypothetical protein
MALSNDLISQFVKVTKDKAETKSETIVYGTVQESIAPNGLNYVKIDGSDLLTPVSSTTVISANDRVTILVKNHTAVVTGNLTSPAVRKEDAVDVSKLNAQTARINELETANATIEGTLTANSADIETLKTNTATISGKVTANEAEIATLKSTSVSAEVISSTYATIASLNTQKGRIDTLETEKLSASDIEGKYANIDFSNISKATMGQFYADSGLIQNVVVGESTITGKLVGVTISGDLIEGNTVKAEKLVIKGTDGLYYKLNTDGVTTEAQQTNQNSLDGSVIKAKTITATKVNVSDLVAFGATIGGFNITDSAIYSGAKTTSENTTRGIYLGKDAQASIGDGTSYIKYYKDTDGSYKLAISADSMVLASGTDVQTTINELSQSTQGNSEDLTAYISATNSKLEELQGQVDGSIMTWFYEYEPTNSNVPASDWTTTDLKNVHLGDLFYNTITGYCYRWQVLNNAYSWNRITDVDVTKALSDAAAAQDTADKKRRVFTATPTTPYDVGDLWSQGSTGELMRCKVAKTASQSYAAADWEKASKYTDDTKAEAAKTAADNAQADADALKTRMTSAETSITQNSEQIALRATKTEVSTAQSSADAAQSDVNALKTRVTSAETSITQNADAIALRATKTEVSTAKTEAITEAGNQAADKVNAIKLGGRNLLIDSGVERTNNEYCAAWYTPSSPLVAGETYTATICVAPAEGVTRFALFLSGGYSHRGDFSISGTEKQIISATFTAVYANGKSPSDNEVYNHIQFYRYPNDGTVTSNSTIHWVKIEKGNKATDWTPAPEDVDTSIADAKKAGTDAQADIDALATRVTSAETSISQNSDAIALRATKTELSTAKSDAISQSKTYADNKVNGVQIGGRNILLNSRFRDNGDEWIQTVNIKDYPTKYNRKCAHFNHEAFGTTKYVGQSVLGKLEPNTAYTMSGWVLAENIVLGTTNPTYMFYHSGNYDNNGTSTWFGYGSKGIPLNSGTGTWTRLVWTFTTDDKVNTETSSVIQVHTRDLTGDIYFCDLKLEKGNKATDWTPAPEDSESAISDLDTRMTSAESSITVMANSIESNVTETTNLGTRTTTLEQTADGLTARISTAENDISTAMEYAESAEELAAQADYRQDIKDTRGDNQTPKWYMENYPKHRVVEFKQTSVIGLSGPTFCSLETIVIWPNNSGGYPKQVATVNEKQYWRVGTSDTTWGDWMAASETATNFLNLSTADGLVVGDRTAGTLKGNIQLKAETGGASISLRDGTTILTKFSATSKAFTGVTSATTTTSSVTESTEGEDGTATSETIVSASQTIIDDQTKSVVKFESANPIYFSQGIATNGVIINDDSLISNVDFTLNGRIFDKNGKSAFEPITGAGNLSIGYGRYKAATASSTDSSILYGNQVRLAAKKNTVITYSGSTALDTMNTNGNMVVGYHLYKKGSGNLHLYAGDSVMLRAKQVYAVDSTGNTVFEAKNSSGNTTLGYARYVNGGETNIYGGSGINLSTNSGNVVSNCSIIPSANSYSALGKYNEKGWSNIYIGNSSGVYNGLRMIVDGASENMCGRDGEGRYIFGNNGSIMYYYVKNVSETANGTGFRFTSGNFDAGNNTVSTWLFGAADSTSRYMGSYLAYNRTYTASANMVVTSNGVFGRNSSSSQRYKRDIITADIDDLKGLYDLPIKKFKYKNDYIAPDDELYDKYLYGFIVEDLEDVLPCAVQHELDADGKPIPEMWNNNVIVPSLLKLIQDLNDRLKKIEMEKQ